VVCPLLGVLVAVLDGCTVGTTWELLSLLRDARGLSGKSGVRCKSNTQCLKLCTPWVLNLVSRLLIHEVSGDCARWRPGRFVFINKQTTGYESNWSDLTSWTKKSPGTRVYISLLPAYSSILFSSCIEHTPSILNYLDIMWLVQNNSSLSQTHPITYTTLYVPSALLSASCNCIIMLLPRM